MRATQQRFLRNSYPDFASAYTSRTDMKYARAMVTPPPRQLTELQLANTSDKWCNNAKVSEHAPNRGRPQYERTSPCRASLELAEAFFVTNTSNREKQSRASVSDKVLTRAEAEASSSKFILKVSSNVFLDAGSPDTWEGRWINDGPHSGREPNCVFAAAFNTNAVPGSDEQFSKKSWTGGLSLSYGRM